MSQTTTFNVVTVERTSDGKCSLCGENVIQGAKKCHIGHPLGTEWHKPDYGKGHPIRLVVAEANGTKCILCGGQVDDGNTCSVLRHEMGRRYPMNRENTPSLFA